MTNIDFYYDPCCPFCWITSRWLLDIQHERHVEIRWRPFSLALKNNELDGDHDATTSNGSFHREAHRVLRIIEAARQRGIPTIDIYSAFGRTFHTDEIRNYSDATIAAVLAQQHLPADLADAADDTTYDTFLAQELRSAIEAAGEDVGVPTIVFTDGRTRRGYFGPVLNTMPSHEEGLALWEGLVKLAPLTCFYELKRSRPQGYPDVASTTGL